VGQRSHVEEEEEEKEKRAHDESATMSKKRRCTQSGCRKSMKLDIFFLWR
jgi:hypothetical protein